jgi:hypothetical protein
MLAPDLCVGMGVCARGERLERALPPADRRICEDSPWQGTAAAAGLRMEGRR